MSPGSCYLSPDRSDLNTADSKCNRFVQRKVYFRIGSDESRAEDGQDVGDGNDRLSTDKVFRFRCYVIFGPWGGGTKSFKYSVRWDIFEILGPTGQFLTKENAPQDVTVRPTKVDLFPVLIVKNIAFVSGFVH